jgi:lipopolysaccharide heptosyltransferase I
MPESAQKFLIIRLSSIGDIVHALPAVAALGEAYPQAEIHWVVETRHARLLEGNRFVHRVIPIDTLGWRKNLTSRSTMQEVRRGIGTLRETHYAATIDFQGLYKSALIAWLSRARERVGFAEFRLREPAAGVFYTARIAARELTHVIELNLALVEHLGVPRLDRARWQFPLPASDADEEYVGGQLRAHNVQDFVIINPGGGWQSKCWAPEDYAQLIRQYSNEFQGDFVLTGSPAEAPVIERIIQESGVARARYLPSTITQFIALARRAKLLVGGDTGPLHLAAAVGTPIVAIYGPTDPGRNGPLAPHNITLWNHGPIDYTRRAAKAGFIAGISVDSVLAALRQRLARING